MKRPDADPANVDRLLEIHEAAVAEYQEQLPELLGIDLVRLDHDQWLDVIRWSGPVDDERMAAVSACTPLAAEVHALMGDELDHHRGELPRDRASTCDLDQAETIRRLLERVGRPSDFRRLAQAALAEPPRVRAMLGALGQQAGAPAPDLSRLRASLNPISRFDFGVLSGLTHAREWQAK